MIEDQVVKIHALFSQKDFQREFEELEALKQVKALLVEKIQRLTKL